VLSTTGTLANGSLAGFAAEGGAGSTAYELETTGTRTFRRWSSRAARRTCRVVGAAWREGCEETANGLAAQCDAAALALAGGGLRRGKPNAGNAQRREGRVTVARGQPERARRRDHVGDKTATVSRWTSIC
jgi:hypothetical protein